MVQFRDQGIHGASPQISLFGDPHVYVLPGLLGSFGKRELLHLRVVEFKTGLLKCLWRENIQGGDFAK